MIIDNAFYSIGDSQIIKSDALVMGLVSLTSFSDVTSGEIPVRYFEKSFRYSINGGLSYSPWMDLSNPNISGISTNPLYPFLIEYKYTRAGESTDGFISFESIELNGQFIALPTPIGYENSMFEDFFGAYDTNVIDWCTNVTSKLYGHGIVAEYLERGRTENISDDEDYIAFWRSISCFFSVLVNVAVKLAQFSSDKAMLVEFLTGRGLFVSMGDDITLLQRLMRTYYKEMKKRGTLGVFSYDDQYVGEFYRIIQSDPSEAIVIFPKYIYSGWFVDENSPTYRGNYDDNDFVVGFGKEHEATADYINKYKVSGSMSVLADTVNGNEVSTILSSGVSEIASSFHVNPTQAYEVTFWVKHPAGKSFSVDAELSTLKLEPVALKDLVTGLDSDGKMIESAVMARSGDWFRIRAIVQPYNSPLASSAENDSHTGVDLKFNNSSIGILKLILNIEDGVQIYDVKARVAVRINSSVNYNNAVQVYAKNNNSSYSPSYDTGVLTFPDLEDVIKTYLLPYKNTLMINWL